MSDQLHANEARFSLIVLGGCLDCSQVTESLGLQPTRFVREGEVLNRLPKIVADKDEWVYTITLTDYDGTDMALNDMLDHLIERKSELLRLCTEHQVTLRMYVQSNYARIAYHLMPETLTKLCEIGLPLSVSSLSWGDIGI